MAYIDTESARLLHLLASMIERINMELNGLAELDLFVDEDGDPDIQLNYTNMDSGVPLNEAAARLPNVGVEQAVSVIAAHYHVEKNMASVVIYFDRDQGGVTWDVSGY